MGKLRPKNYSIFLFTVLVILAAAVLRQIGFMTEGPMKLFCAILRPLIYIGMFVIWSVSLRRRTIQPQVRRYLTAISTLMVFWLTVRTTKYLFTEDPWTLRHLWYLYYLPMLFIPLLGLLVALSLGKAENFRLPKWTASLFIPSAALFLLVLTNDFHQMVFDFPEDAAVWENDYSYGVGYFLAVGWMILCALAALVTMLVKCRIPNSRRVFLLPFLPTLLALVYGIFDALRLPWLKAIAGDMTVVFCLLFAAVLECCIRCGLIQTNTGYGQLFETGTIGAQITDDAYQIRYASSNAMHLSPDVMRDAETGSVSLDKNTLLKSSRITGGHVLWQEDITDMTALLEKLEELYRTYGYCMNTLHSYEFEGSAGFAKMQSIMQAFRGDVKAFGGKKVVKLLDYAQGLDGLPKSDVLKFLLEGNCSIVVRPSGTEPKLKIYISVSAADKEAAEDIEAEIVKDAEKWFE